MLYFTAKKFHVDEHPQIEAIASLLPGANCGGCGFKGCRDFAAACVSRGNLDGIFCPVTGADGMERIAGILGVKSDIAERRIAVLKCNGTCEARPLRYTYDGVRSCRVMDAVSVGARGCAYGCLGCGDCVDVCRFGAIKIDTATGIAVVDPENVQHVVLVSANARVIFSSCVPSARETAGYGSLAVAEIKVLSPVKFVSVHASDVENVSVHVLLVQLI